MGCSRCLDRPATVSESILSQFRVSSADPGLGLNNEFRYLQRSLKSCLSSASPSKVLDDRLVLLSY